ncbi:hypothetical protein MN608_06733 [Microdochium nivale]|nr:hypothetical protein MN608_06733 [Microdochium nivale]
MAGPPQFNAPSVDMAISVRVEVYDSREAASKKKSTPIAKFRMRTPASTTFGGLGISVTQRYMKESAGAITVRPSISSIVDKEDCAFDLDDTIDIVTPNEAIRFVLNRAPRQEQAQPPSTAKQNPQPAPPSRVPISKTRTAQEQQSQPEATPDGRGNTTEQSQVKAASSSSRRPFLLSERQATAAAARTTSEPSIQATQPPSNPSVATTTSPSMKPKGRAQDLTKANSRGQTHRAISTKPPLASSKKRDPYDIESDDNGNDLPSWDNARARGQRQSLSAATQPQRRTQAPLHSDGPAATAALLRQEHSTSIVRDATKQQWHLIAKPISINGSSSSSSPSVVTPNRHPDPAQKSQSREQALDQIHSGANVVVVSATDSNEVLARSSSPETRFRGGNVTTANSKTDGPVLHSDLRSVAESSEDDDFLSQSISKSQAPSLRSLGKKSYHTVNEHIEIVDQPEPASKSAAPTPILLKNSRGVFPVYRRGEAPALLSDTLPATDSPNARVKATAQSLQVQSSPGARRRPRTEDQDTADLGRSSGFAKQPVSMPPIDFETEFAGFEELSDFEIQDIRPSARSIMSEPRHRTRTPSRSSMKTSRATGQTHDFQASIHPRSSPLESKQRRLSRSRKEPQPRSAATQQPREPPPRRGSNNRASREPSVILLHSIPRAKSPQKPPTPAAAPSSVERGPSGDDIRKWIARRQMNALRSSPREDVTVATKPVSAKAAVRRVKSMTELKFQAKPKQSKIPPSFFAESDNDDDDDDDETSNAVSVVEVMEARRSEDAVLPRSSQPVSPQKPQSSRASSRRSSLSSHRSYTKQGRIPSSPFYPVDSLTVEVEKDKHAEITQHFGRGYNKRVRQVFSDASESSDAEMTPKGGEEISHERVIAPGKSKIMDTDHYRLQQPPIKQIESSYSSVQTGTTALLSKKAPLSAHPARRPWWHPWGWINRYETVFLPGGIIGNGPFEGYELFNETPGVYMVDCEPPTDELLAAEDLTCKKDQFRLLCRRERRRERRLHGNYLEHEDDGYDSPAELALEFTESDDAYTVLGSAVSVEISDSVDSGSELESESEASPDDLGFSAKTSHSHQDDEFVPRDLALGIAGDSNARHDATDATELDNHLDDSGVVPSREQNLLEGSNEKAVPDDRLSERTLRMERTRHYALTGETSSQSQESVSTPIHNPIRLKQLTGASTATSGNSTSTSIQITRQLTSCCVNSPPSNQELALLLSSSPSKRQHSHSVTPEPIDAPMSMPDSKPAALAWSAPVLGEAGATELQIEVPQTPMQAQNETQGTDRANLARATNAIVTAHSPPASDGQISPVIVEESDSAKSDLIIEIPSLSPEQRAEYSVSQPRQSTSPKRPRTFGEINAAGNDINSPLFSLPRLTGESDPEDETVSPTVVARAKRRVTFGSNVSAKALGDDDVLEAPHKRGGGMKPVSLTPLKRKSPTNDIPAASRRVPVVSFVLSDSDRDDEDSVISSEADSDVVEIESIPVIRSPKESIKEKTPAPTTRPDTPDCSSAKASSTLLSARLSASQPLPTSYVKPRVVTPIPPPVIPASSTSSVYLNRPNIIEIKSSDSSESNRDSDVVMLSEPILLHQRTQPITATLNATPSTSIQPVASKPVGTTKREVIGVPDGNYKVLHVSSTAPTRGRSRSPTRSSKQAKKNKKKREQKKRRRSARYPVWQGDVQLPKTLDSTFIGDPAGAGEQLLASMTRYRGQRDFRVGTAPSTNALKCKKEKRRRRSAQWANTKERSNAVVGNAPSPACGQKRKHREEGHHEHAQHTFAAAHAANHSLLSGTMLRDAAALAGKPPKHKKRKLSHEDDDEDHSGGPICAKSVPPQSSSANIPSSSHPSLISPPTTSRPSSAGSRGV